MVLVGLLLRLGYMIVFRTWHFISPGPWWVTFAFGYETGSIAHSIATGHGFGSPFLEITTGPTAWIAPVYPYLCAGIFKLFGMFTTESAIILLSLNSVFSALTCVPIYLLGERTAGKGVGWWAGWTWAVVPLFMRWGATWVWEISLSALLMSLAFLWALELGRRSDWKPWLGFGVFWGVSALTNPSLLAFLPFSGSWPAYRLWRSGRPWLRPVVIASLAFWISIAPWLVRNRVALGHWVFIRDNFWFEFHLGNYHLSNGMGWTGKHPTSNRHELAEYARLGEVAYVAEKKRAALQFVRQYPGEFLGLTWLRFKAFWDGSSLLYTNPRLDPWRPWKFWPLSALTAFGAVLALGNRVPGGWLFLCGILFYPLPYYLAFPQARYRHPIEPVMLILSVYFCREAALYFRQRWWKAAPTNQEEPAVVAGR
jgi:4-amino-4-deoxy-L-arabinose transferase-like glycosyltransferase